MILIHLEFLDERFDSVGGLFPVHDVLLPGLI